MTDPFHKIKSTILKGLGKSDPDEFNPPKTNKRSSISTQDSDSNSNPRGTEQQQNAIDPTVYPASSKTGVSGHVETDYSDMTAEWEPNRLERAENMARRVLGENAPSSTITSTGSSGSSSSAMRQENVKPQSKEGGDQFNSDTSMAVLIGEHFGS